MNYTGDKISFIRQKHNMSQEKLAEIVGVSRQTIYKWEYGIVQPSEENIKSLCVAFGVDNDYFIEHKNDEIAITTTTKKSDKKPDKKLIIFSIILGILFSVGLAVSIALGYMVNTPNTGFLSTNSGKINFQQFIAVLVITILLFVSDLTLIGIILVKKYKCKPNVNTL